MSNSRILDYDPLTGIKKVFHWDESNGKFHIETLQDIEPILEMNKNLFNNNDYRKQGLKEDMVHYATIPESIQVQWLQEGINIYNKDHWPRVKAKLNHPDFRKLRTSSGKI